MLRCRLIKLRAGAPQTFFRHGDSVLGHGGDCLGATCGLIWRCHSLMLPDFGSPAVRYARMTVTSVVLPSVSVIVARSDTNS